MAGFTATSGVAVGVASAVGFEEDGGGALFVGFFEDDGGGTLAFDATGGGGFDATGGGGFDATGGGFTDGFTGGGGFVLPEGSGGGCLMRIDADDGGPAETAG